MNKNGYKIISEMLGTYTVSYALLVACDFFIQYLIGYILNRAFESMPIDKNWTAFLNKNLPLKLKNKYVVRIMKENSPNAFKTMGDNNIYLTTGMIKRFTKEEIMAVLAHEIGHSVYHHSEQKILGSAVLLSLLKIVSILIEQENAIRAGIGISFDIKTQQLISVAKYASKPRIPYKRIILPLMILVWISVPMLFRFTENVADSYASKLGYKEELTRALIKLYRYKKIKPTSLLFKIMRGLSKIMKTHPSIKKRLIKILGSEEAIEAFKESKNGKDLKEKINQIMKNES